MGQRRKPSDVIYEFVAFQAKYHHPGLCVHRRPDCENRNSPDIDAIAGIFAIEHTSIDSVKDQREKDYQFDQVILDLEKKLSWQLPFYLRIVFDYDAITKGQNWSEIHEALQRWILDVSPRLEYGEYDFDKIPSIPFTLHVDKRMQCEMGRGLYFVRKTPDELRPDPDRIQEQLDRKAKTLAKYQNCGKTTVLLIESYDPFLMNESIMVTAIRSAYSGALPHGVDKIWYAPNTSIEGRIKFKDITGVLLAQDYPTKKSVWEEIEEELKTNTARPLFEV